MYCDFCLYSNKSILIPNTKFLKMFNTKHNECVGFDSRWKVKKVYSNTSSQTTDSSVSERGTSTNVSESIEIQTDQPAPVPELKDDVDMNKLAGWLKKIYPGVKKAIDDCNNSRAFRGYKLIHDLEVNCKLLQNINISNFAASDVMSSTKISALTWNHIGKSLAFTSNFDHKSWCHHTGTVYIYTLTRNNQLPDQPKKKLKTESCVFGLRFHPSRSNILAASTATGSVIIWNIEEDDGEEVITTKGVHEQVVTQISWANDLSADKKILLATASTDGFLKLWKFDVTSIHEENVLTLKVRYKVKPPILTSLRRADKPKNMEEDEQNVFDKTSNGIICFDFSKHLPDMFLVGLEGGHIVQCSLLGATELKGSSKVEPLFDPSFKYYEPHEGELLSINFSPNRKEQFMSYGTDAEIRIYILDQTDPAQLIFIKSTLLDLTFIPFEDKLLAGCGLNGFIEIYHLQKAKRVENITKEHIKKKATSTSLSINPASNNIVALGSVNGDIQLWNVPWASFSY